MLVKKPSVNDIVSYKRMGLPNSKYKGAVVPALVVGIDQEDPRNVDLIIFTKDGVHFSDNKVSYGKKLGHWSWPKTSEEMMEV